MKKGNYLITQEIEVLLKNKNIGDIINFETDNVYNKSAVSKIIKNYIFKNCFYDTNMINDQKIRLKFISVNEKYNCFEPMSFSNTSLYDVIFEKWNTNDEFELATFKNQLTYNFILIPIIKIKKNGVYNNYLNWTIGEFSYWNPSAKEIEMIGMEWLNVQKILRNGLEINRIKYGKSFRNTNNLPKQSETNFIHMRPHGKDSYDYDLKYLKYTKGEKKITKQSFWLNKKFINSLLIKYKWKTILKEE